MNKRLFPIVIILAVLVVSVGLTNAEYLKKWDKEKAIGTFEKQLSNVEYVPDEIIVKFKPGTSDDVISRINSRHKTFVKYTSLYGKFKKMGIPAGKTVSEMVEIYRKNPNVEYAEPNYIAHALMVPNDPYYAYQWHLDNAGYGGIGMEEAWDISTGSGVIVAIVDTGIAYENYGWRYKKAPDLADTCFVTGYDFVNDDTHPNDDNSHGTHVAGTVAQSTNNNLGVAGVAFDACLMPVKVLDRGGSGSYADVADGIIWAADNGAQVISLSLGGSAPSTTLENAVTHAYNNGVTVIAAAGNDASPSLSYPAAYDDYVIAVGATRYDETLAYYSNYGSSLDLVAPGGDLNVDQNGDGYGDGVLQNTFNPNTRNTRDFGYWFFQGTSMATPHVSGVAALLIANGVTGPDDVREALQNTAEDKGDPGWDPEYGWGIVDAYAALNYGPTTTTTAIPTTTTTIPTTSTTTTSSTTTTILNTTSTSTSTTTSIPTTTSTIPTTTTTIPTTTTTIPTTTTTTSTTTTIPTTKCWSGDYQYLYRNRNQARKFCKCAMGTYGYNSYSYSWERKTVYYYLDSGDNENWNVDSRRSYLPVYRVVCTDGQEYSTNQDYYYG